MATPPSARKLHWLFETCQRVFEERQDRRIVGVFLYGSMVQGNSRTDSDIDIAVLDAPDDRLSWKDEAQLMDALERATGGVVDLRMMRDTSLSHQIHILKEGKLIWTADEKTVEDYRRRALSSDRSGDQVHKEWLSSVGRLAGRLGVER